MNNKTNRRPFARLMAVLMAMAMVISVVFMQASAEKANFEPPKKAMSIDYKQITVAAHSQGYITPEVLGLTNTTSRARELPAGEDGSVGMSLADAQKMAVLGVFGSDINENPNPYLYNYFYNTWAQSSENKDGAQPAAFEFYTLSKDVNGSPNGATAAGGYSKYGITVPASLYLEPEILIGINPVDTQANTTGYTNALNAYNDAKKASTGTTAIYDPYQVQYEMTHVYSFLQTLYDLSDIVHAIQKEDSTRTTRYGDPEIITKDVEKYVKGLEAYVIKQLKKDNAKPVTVAVIDTAYTDTLKQAGTLKAGQYVANDKTCSTQQTTSFSRVGEFVADTATNLIDALPTKPARQSGEGANSFANEYYVVTADQIAQYADIVLFCDVLSSVPENTGTSKVDSFKQDVATNCSTNSLKAKVSDIEMMSSAFDCVGSIGANSVENLLGMAYYTAYMYPQYLNQFDVAAYWYENFYHVTDLNKLKSVMASNFATSSVQDEYAKSYSAANLNYDKQAVEDKIIEGMRYYEDNASEFKDKLLYQNGQTGEDTGWVIDWTQGIGAGQREEPVQYNGVVKGPDGKWGYYVDDVLQTNYTGIKNNDYGWWRIENGLVNFNANGIYKNEYGWWKTTNGKVTFNETGVFKNEYGWWRVEKSKVNFKANGIYKNDYGWWKTTNGKVTFKETGVYKNDYGWWRVEKSKVNFKANGLYKNEYGTWYVKNGKVDFSYNGTYQGKTIKNGKVV